MKEQKKIPTSKVNRASRFMKTGMKVGGNYLRHYSQKLVNPELNKDDLNQRNAEEIYGTLSELKGSALKVAQMLSMDKSVLPSAFIDKFTEAQYQAPALSGPLVVKTLKQYLQKSPLELFDSFDLKAAHAASMGQVHRAEKDGHSLAVKIQYPGVGDSVVSDLKLVRPFARAMFGWKDVDLDLYFEEVQERLLEETDYALELERAMMLTEQCQGLESIVFPKYYSEWSSKRVITMEWIEGMHLDQYLATNPDQEERNTVGQAIWDFYNFQIHQLQVTHADAHPGNFLFLEDGRVGVLDFGCVKVIPQDFYENYFALLQPEILEDEAAFLSEARKGGIIMDSDTEEEKDFYLSVLRDTLGLLCRPFHQEYFDFSEQAYFDEIYAFGENMARSPELRKTKSPRGSQHGLYLNRTFFGLFMILHKLQAKVETGKYLG